MSQGSFTFARDLEIAPRRVADTSIVLQAKGWPGVAGNGAKVTDGRGRVSAVSGAAWRENATTTPNQQRHGAPTHG